MNKNLLITHKTRMSYPYICIAGIDLEIFHNLAKGICLPNNIPIEIRPMLLNNEKWNLDNHKSIRLYSIYQFEGNYSSEDNSKEDFYVHSFKISEEKYDIKNLIKNYIKISQEHVTCCATISALNNLIYTTSKSFLPFSKPHETLGTFDASIDNIYLKGNQWRCNFSPSAWNDEGTFFSDIPITDIGFYDTNNNFKAKDLEGIRKIFTFDKDSSINGLISIGLSREFKGKRWLQINTIHPESFFSKDYLFSCPLCSSEVIDYRNSKPSSNFPHFRCSNEECDQGNGFSWSSWNEKEFD